MADGLGITMCLVEMLPTIPLHLAFHSSTPGLTRFAPAVYAARPQSRMDILDFSHMPPLKSSWKALDVLCEEIIKNVCGTTEKDKGVAPTWLMSMANVPTVGVKPAKVGASDGPTSSPHASCSPGQHSQTTSPSSRHHSQSSRSSSSSSGSGSRSGSASGSRSSGSSQLGSGNESLTGSPAGSHAESQVPSEGSSSSGSECSHSASPDVVLLQGDDEDTTAGGEDEGYSEDKEALLQGMVSLLNISTSDNEEACKATACETARKSDIQYGNWWDEQIHQRKEGIAQHNKQVNDYADGGRPSKAPDKIGPLFSYMEEHGVFKSLDTIANPLGLCRFYWTNPQESNVVTGPKSAAGACRIKHLLELAKELGWPLTIVVFEGDTVTPLGILQELHSQLTLSCIPIHTLEEAKLGQKNRVSCCPICVYIVKNDYVFLNHIVICHYWSSFSCGKCLEFVVSSGQQMKKHFPKCGGLKEVCEKADSKGRKSSKPHGSDKSGRKPKKGKKDEEDKDDKHGEKDDKPSRSDSKSGNKATSQEQVLESLCHILRITGSTSGGGHHKKSKKCGKKKSHKKSHQKMCP